MQQFAFGNFTSSSPTAILNEESGRGTRENNGNVPLFSRWPGLQFNFDFPTEKVFLKVVSGACERHEARTSHQLQLIK